MERTVIVLCGPPGAGKTTAARTSGLAVYDRDDYPDERAFLSDVSSLAQDPDAQAVVIRWAPSSHDRERIASQAGATHVYLMVEDRDTLARRINQRGRADRVGTLAALKTWFAQYDRDDDVTMFKGWPTGVEPKVTAWDW